MTVEQELRPTASDHRPDLRPARLVAAATLVVGACVLGWSLSIPAGSGLFYLATLLLAGVWIGGALATQRALHGPAASRADAAPQNSAAAQDHDSFGTARAGANGPHQLLLGGLVGAILVGVFLVGALVLAHVPALRAPVDALLDHADQGVFTVVLALTMLNGVAEEMFFRGALFSVLTGWRPLVTSTLVYTAATAASGIWMLALAGLVLGAVAAVLRHRTGGIAAPIATHLVWQLGMIFLLPAAIDLWS